MASPTRQSKQTQRKEHMPAASQVAGSSCASPETASAADATSTFYGAWPSVKSLLQGEIRKKGNYKTPLPGLPSCCCRFPRCCRSRCGTSSIFYLLSGIAKCLVCIATRESSKKAHIRKTYQQIQVAEAWCTGSGESSTRTVGAASTFCRALPSAIVFIATRVMEES